MKRFASALGSLWSWFAAPGFVLLIVLLMLLGALPAQAQTTPSVTFGVSGTSSDGRTVAPVLTWSTTPAATSCTASGDASWTGTKAASGTATLPATSTSKAYALVCNWPGVTLATITWTAPTTNVDGSAYSNPGGFRIQYSQDSADLAQSVYLQDPTVRSWTAPANLAAGTWYFGVRAYNALGLESALSNVTNKTLTASAQRNASVSLVITVPNAPGGVTAQ